MNNRNRSVNWTAVVNFSLRYKVEDVLTTSSTVVCLEDILNIDPVTAYLEDILHRYETLHINQLSHHRTRRSADVSKSKEVQFKAFGRSVIKLSPAYIALPVLDLYLCSSGYAPVLGIGSIFTNNRLDFHKQSSVWPNRSMIDCTIGS